jgi:PhnB protein
MSITTTTHLNFRGDARAALEFYGAVFGGVVTIATYGDFGMPKDAPGADGVVFGSVESPGGFRVMAYDIPGRAGGSTAVAGGTRRENGTTITDQPFFVSVRGETLEEIQGYWEGLAAAASIVEPLAASAWSPGFGMLTDRFGVTWVLDVAAEYAADAPGGSAHARGSPLAGVTAHRSAPPRRRQLAASVDSSAPESVASRSERSPRGP